MSEMYSANQSSSEDPQIRPQKTDDTLDKKLATLETTVRAMREQLSTFNQSLEQAHRTIRRQASEINNLNTILRSRK